MIVLKKNPFFSFLKLYILLGFITRIILLFHPITQASFQSLDLLKVFVVGAINDLAIAVLLGSFLGLYLLTLSNTKFSKPWGIVGFASLSLLLLYIASGKSILSEYGGVLPEIALVFVGIKTLLFGIMLQFPQYRTIIRKTMYSLTLFLMTALMVQNAVSEFFFWNEFGLRYNFIAVDYLVYTNEVIGNIMESYPVVPLFTAIGIVAITITYFVVKQTQDMVINLPSLSTKIKALVLYSVLFTLSIFSLPHLAKLENGDNIFANELQANGLYKFYRAFQNSSLDYNTFYPTLPEAKVQSILQAQGITPFSIQTINASSPELRKNIVLITIESYSAEFMKHYGNTQNITPFLDTLSDQSMFFTNLYAVGNRTVRGLEAVTLCLPPSPGESVVKRKDNKQKFSTGSILQSKGYAVNYLYGGDAYFDNMEDFFGGNGYAIVDKKKMKPEEITFSNVWGVCDEDMAQKAIRVMNEESQKGNPFFNHWMTVSNHRPFTYPEHKINIDANSKSREGGVKYTDYALRQFFKAAQKQPWFANTVFVIVADHCASSSGKTELPLHKYRIPALIYAPGFIKPQKITTLMSQIDVMPTLFGLLHLKYKSKFIGKDIFSPNYQERAFIATYQDLGYIKDNKLTLLSPKNRIRQYDLKLNPTPGLSQVFQEFYDEIPRKKIDEKLVHETIAFYQYAAQLLRDKKYQRIP